MAKGLAAGLCLLLFVGCESSPTQQVKSRFGSSDTTETRSAATDSAVAKISERLDTVLAEVDSLKQDVSDLVPKKSAAYNLSDLGLRLIGALLVLILTYYAIRVLVWVLETASDRSATRRLFYKKLIPVARIVAWSVAIYIVVRYVFGVTGDQLLLAGGAIGLGVGLAMQDVLKNIFGGVLIILDQPFQVGDKIRVGGTYGEVVSIGLRSTRIVTPDDNLVSVPNRQVVDGQVANATGGNLDCQVVTTLYLPGWVDVVRAKEIAYAAAANSRYVFLDKPIVVLIQDDFKETFLTKIVVKAYVIEGAKYEFVFSSDITETAKAEYLRLGMLQPMVPLMVTDLDNGMSIAMDGRKES